MELLTYPRTEYLLDASLESLHAESLEWLKEIDFWSDEMAFFYTLLHKKEIATTFPTEELASIEKELIRVNGERLDTARSSVQSHERVLASLLKTTSFHDEENYREAHRKLLLDIYDVQNMIRTFKKSVFEFVKKYE